MSCCQEYVIKYILFIANLLFALGGLVLLIVGIVVQLKVTEVVTIGDVNFQVAPISAMIVGSIVFLIAFFGCCGAVRESNCMLVTFSIFMLVLMVAKITLASLIFVNIDTVVDDVPRWLQTAFAKDSIAFREIETTFSCCGPTGHGAYRNTTLPDSCCALPPCTDNNAFDGCDEIIQSFFTTFGYIIGIAAIVIVAFELVAAVFGLCLANHVRNKYRRRAY